MNRSWIEHSRVQWCNTNGDSDIPSDDRIQIGCLQRIADAAEKMAKSHDALIQEAARYKRWYEQEKAAAERLRRSNSALRGCLRLAREGRGRR